MKELLGFLGVDFRNNYGPSYVGQSFKKHPDGTVEDLWGVKRKTVVYGKGTSHQGSYSEVAESPLEKLKTLEEIKKIRPLGQSRLVGLFESQGRLHGLPSQYCVIKWGDRLDRTSQLKPMMYLRGSSRSLSIWL